MTRQLANVCRKKCQLNALNVDTFAADSNQRGDSVAPPQTNSEPMAHFSKEHRARKTAFIELDFSSSHERMSRKLRIGIFPLNAYGTF